MSAYPILLFILGLLVLVAGAELLVRGATRLAASLGVSPLVIGLTVVAFGTSSPELAVSVQAGLLGRTDLALGNVVGSNIFNVLLILGIAALVAPLVIAEQLLQWDVPLMIGASMLLWVMALDGTVGRIEGIMLFAGLLGYVGWSIRQASRASSQIQTEFAREFSGRVATVSGVVAQLALVGGGLLLLVLGAGWLVDGAGALARTLGLSELVIGLTVVAAGTSLPEVATSVVASLRGERDIAVGNVVGSNLFNILGVLGLSAAVSDGGIAVSAAALSFDIPVMTAVAIACLPIFFTGHVISRWEGAVFLAYYAAYTLYLILAATRHDLLPAFSGFMIAFVIPLTVITLFVLVARTLTGRSSTRA